MLSEQVRQAEADLVNAESEYRKVVCEAYDLHCNHRRRRDRDGHAEEEDSSQSPSHGSNYGVDDGQGSHYGDDVEDLSRPTSPVQRSMAPLSPITGDNGVDEQQRQHQLPLPDLPPTPESPPPIEPPVAQVENTGNAAVSSTDAETEGESTKSLYLSNPFIFAYLFYTVYTKDTNVLHESYNLGKKWQSSNMLIIFFLAAVKSIMSDDQLNASFASMSDGEINLNFTQIEAQSSSSKKVSQNFVA